MKLTIEIKVDKFLFDYEVGTSKGHSEIPLSADTLINFVSLLQICRQTTLFENREELDEFRAISFLEKNPEIIKKYSEKVNV